LNSEEFRETFLRTTEKGPPRPRWRRRRRKPTLEEKRDLRLGQRKKPRRTTPQGRKELWGMSKQQKRKG
ncbi:MAG: hypothetical protein ACK55Z_30340, partial [bacterium]